MSLIWHHCAAMDLKTRTSKNPSFFFNHHKSKKEPSRFFLFSWVTIKKKKKTEIFHNNKIFYDLIKELTTHLLKRKYFCNQIKILYPLWGVQPNLENNNQRSSIYPNIINKPKLIIMKKKIIATIMTFIHPFRS